MYNYLIHIERDDIGPYEMRDPQTQARVRGYNTSTDIEVERERNVMNTPRGREHKLETWYAIDRPAAENIAKVLAAQRPGRQVYICQVVAVASAGVPRVGVANVTEQGLVPA